MRWHDLTPEQRDQLVADELMEGERARYTQDINAAWQVASWIIMSMGPSVSANALVTPEDYVLHLQPVSQRGERCKAWFGNHMPIIAPPAEAICLAALYRSGITFEDGHTHSVAEKKLGGPDVLSPADYIAF